MKTKFCTSDQKGFQITFENGYTASVQFGVGNYCDNYDAPFSLENAKSRQVSTTAETAIIDPKGDFVKYKGDVVQAYQKPSDVLKTLIKASKMKPKD